ncbi:MAG: glutaredoxin family protein [Candidatus Paceibacterota bacterium]
MSKKVVIYSTPTCHFCHMAKEFFQEKGIEYTEYDVAADMDKRKEMVEKTGQLGVPVIEIDGQATVGFDKDKIEALL